MNQINLFCTRCFETLKFADYREHLENPEVPAIACLYCGRVVLTMDVDEPKLLSSYRRKLEFEQKIIKLCSLTGMTVAEMENYVRENDLSPEKMDNLIDSIIEGKKQID